MPRVFFYLIPYANIGHFPSSNLSFRLRHFDAAIFFITPLLISMPTLPIFIFFITPLRHIAFTLFIIFAIFHATLFALIFMLLIIRHYFVRYAIFLMFILPLFTRAMAEAMMQDSARQMRGKRVREKMRDMQKIFDYFFSAAISCRYA